MGNYNYASITFVDRLIRKSIANSAFALSLILESNTPEDSQFFFVQKSVREILSCDDDTQKMKIQSYFSEIVSKHISIFEEIKCVHSTKNSTISVSAFLTQYRILVYFIVYFKYNTLSQLHLLSTYFCFNSCLKERSYFEDL